MFNFPIKEMYIEGDSLLSNEKVNFAKLNI